MGKYKYLHLLTQLWNGSAGRGGRVIVPFYSNMVTYYSEERKLKEKSKLLFGVHFRQKQVLL